MLFADLKQYSHCLLTIEEQCWDYFGFWGFYQHRNSEAHTAFLSFSSALCASLSLNHLQQDLCSLLPSQWRHTSLSAFWPARKLSIRGVLLLLHVIIILKQARAQHCNFVQSLSAAFWWDALGWVGTSCCHSIHPLLTGSKTCIVNVTKSQLAVFICKATSIFKWNNFSYFINTLLFLAKPCKNLKQPMQYPAPQLCLPLAPFSALLSHPLSHSCWQNWKNKTKQQK